MASRLGAYLDSIRARDPAPHSRWEVLTYPGVWALGFHRVAHRLYRRRLYLLARAVNHWSRAWTAIDIHPGAVIGRNFFSEVAPCTRVREFQGRFREGVEAGVLEVTFGYRFRFADDREKDVTVSMRYPSDDGIVWLLVERP